MVDKGDRFHSDVRGDPEPAPHGTRRGRIRWALVLLLIPFVALLYPPWYATLTPRFLGIPFFIWYQFLWVILGVIVTVFVYGVDRPGGRER